MSRARSSRRTWLFMSLVCIGTARAQVPFWSDQFTGGVVTAAFQGAPPQQVSWGVPIPAGSTIHQAFLFAGQLGSPAPDLPIQLNGIPHVFDASNLVGPVWNSVYYGGPSAVHAIDVTAELDPSMTTMELSIDGFSSNYMDFYLYIAYLNPGSSLTASAIYFNGEDSQLNIEYPLPLPFPTYSGAPIAFALSAGYACGGTPQGDGERVHVNGDTLGVFHGADFNSSFGCGASGTFLYDNNTLSGLGDDQPDEEINGPDVLSDISALVPNGSTSIDVRFEHMPSGSPEDNNVWIIFLAYSSEPCSAVLDLGPDATICSGETLVLNATLPGASYLWQDGSDQPTYTVTAAGTYFVQATSDSCSWSDTITVSLSPVPVFDLGADTTICQGEAITLSALSEPIGDVLWSDGSQNTTLPVTVTGTYYATVSIGGCAASDTIQVTVDPIPDVDLGPDVQFCAGDEVVLEVQPGNGTVLWSDGSAGTELVVTSGGTYWCTVTLSACAASDTIQATAIPLPELELGMDVELCVGETWTVDVSVPGGSYLWYDGSEAPVHSFSDTTVAWVSVTANGCTSTDTIAITIVECELEIEMPNVFSPNGDAANQVFRPITLKGVEHLTFTIWNRWGQEVYTSTDIGFAWNGRIFGGSTVPEGTYFWTLNYTAIKSGAKGELHGAVTLLR